MLKPSVIYCIVGAVMLKRGWMNRYLPERAAPVADVATTFGYVWAGLMFASAALNIALALSLDAQDLGGGHVGLGPVQQDRPVPDPVRDDDRDRPAPRSSGNGDGGSRFLIRVRVRRLQQMLDPDRQAAAADAGRMEHRIGDRGVDAGVAELADALDAQRIHLQRRAAAAGWFRCGRCRHGPARDSWRDRALT